MQQPRRSPRLGGLSPKPKLPHKPRQPKRLQDPAADSVRQASYKAELAVWETSKLEHEKKMQKRQAKQTAVWKAARKGAAESDAPPPAAPAPPPQLSADELRLVSDSSPALAERRLAAAAVPPPPPPEKVRHPRLRRSFAKWLLDVEEVAKRCGAGQAQELHPQGRWFDVEDWAEAGNDSGKPGRPHPAQNPRPTCVCVLPQHS